MHEETLLPPRRKFNQPEPESERLPRRPPKHRLSWVVSLLSLLGVGNLMVAAAGGMLAVNAPLAVLPGVSLLFAGAMAALAFFAAAAVVSSLIEMDGKLDRLAS